MASAETAIMAGTFYTTILVENVVRRGETRAVDKALVDTGSEFTWIPRPILEELGIPSEQTARFLVADGRAIERHMGIAIVHAAGSKAPDYVVFAEPDDMVILGAHSLEGMNLRVDALRKQLIPAGPILAGVGHVLQPAANSWLASQRFVSRRRTLARNRPSMP